MCYSAGTVRACACVACSLGACSVERLFEDSVANTPLPLTRVLRPANLSGVTFGFSCLDASVPLPVGAALAKCLLAIVGMGGDVVLPSNSTLLRTASFIELLSASDLQASHGECCVRSPVVSTVGYLSFGPIEKILCFFCDLSACTRH